MKTFINVAQMKLATLQAGQFVETGGDVTKGDGGQARYLVTAGVSPDNSVSPDLANGNHALYQGVGAVNDLSQAYIFDTVAAMKASLIEFPDGKRIYLEDRGADFTKITGTGTGNEKNIIASTSVDQSISLIIGAVLPISQLGATLDYVADDTAFAQHALTLRPSIIIDGDCVLNDLQIPTDRKVEILGDGYPKVKGSTGTYAIENKNRGKFLRLKNIDFRGPIPGYRYSAQEGTLPYGTSGQEYSIEFCRFEMDVGVFGVELFGAREGQLLRCDFEGNLNTGGKGLYRTKSINTELVSCNFRGCIRGIESEQAEGLKVIGGIAIGCNQMLRAIDDIGVQLTQVMWDFNDFSALIYGCGAITIGDSYISGRTANPAVWIKGSGGGVGIGQNSRKAKISNTNIVQNLDVAGSICLKIDDTTGCKIIGNDIYGYMGNGIEYNGSTVTNLNIARNEFDAAPTATGKDITFITADSGSVIIDKNKLDLGLNINTALNRKVSGNIGFITKNSGFGSISGGTSSEIITHNMAVTPPLDSIDVKANSSLGSASSFWVSSSTTTTFTVHTNSDPVTAFNFAWTVELNNR